MNEARVRGLARDEQVELTKKMLKRFSKKQIDLHALFKSLAVSEIKGENVLSYPDFNFGMGLPKKEREYDVVITQTPDGRAVRIVGFIDRRNRGGAK